jgi:hypothetical protein
MEKFKNTEKTSDENEAVKNVIAIAEKPHFHILAWQVANDDLVTIISRLSAARGIANSYFHANTVLSHLKYADEDFMAFCKSDEGEKDYFIALFTLLERHCEKTDIQSAMMEFKLPLTSEEVKERLILIEDAVNEVFKDE